MPNTYVNKVELADGTSLIDISDSTVTAGSMLNGVKAYSASGASVTGNIASKSSSDLTTSGDTVTVPAGYYASQATKAVASGTAGTPTATKGTVSSNSVTVTPSVTNTAGYISGGTKTGTAVTVSASELVSGTKSITSAGTTDVTNYASASVASGTVTAPATISGTSATVSTGTNTLTLTKTVSVTPTVSTAGYVSAGTAGNSSVSLTASVNTRSSSDLTASTLTVTAPSGYYASNATKTLSDENLVAGNIKKDVQIFGVTGTYEGGGGSTTVIIPEQSITCSNTSGTVITNYYEGLIAGEQYIVTINGVAKTITATLETGNVALYYETNLDFFWVNGIMYLFAEDSSAFGTYTAKVEKITGGGGGSTLIEKSITTNGVYNASDDDADGYSKVTVNVSGGTSKNFQVSNTQVRLGNRTTLTDTGLTLTVGETGTYNVYWSAFRSNTSSGYTWGTQLYIGSTAHGSENTSWSNSYNQINKLTGVSLTKNQVLHVYGRTRSGNSYYICCSNLILEQTA